VFCGSVQLCPVVAFALVIKGLVVSMPYSGCLRALVLNRAGRWRTLAGTMTSYHQRDKYNLTIKQRVFADAYIATGRKATAYRLAYDTSGMSDSGVHRESAALLSHCEPVKAYVADRKALAVQIADATTAEVEINAAWVLKKTALLAAFNIRKFLRVENGIAVYDFTDATDDDWYCLDEYVAEDIQLRDGKVFAVGKVKFKAAAKLQALKLLGEHIDVQAFKQQLELSGEVALRALTDDQLDARIRRLTDDSAGAGS